MANSDKYKIMKTVIYIKHSVLAVLFLFFCNFIFAISSNINFNFILKKIDKTFEIKQLKQEVEYRKNLLKATKSHLKFNSYLKNDFDGNTKFGIGLSFEFDNLKKVDENIGKLNLEIDMEGLAIKKKAMIKDVLLILLDNWFYIEKIKILNKILNYDRLNLKLVREKYNLANCSKIDLLLAETKLKQDEEDLLDLKFLLNDNFIKLYEKYNIGKKVIFYPLNLDLKLKINETEEEKQIKVYRKLNKENKKYYDYLGYSFEKTFLKENSRVYNNDLLRFSFDVDKKKFYNKRAYELLVKKLSENLQQLKRDKILTVKEFLNFRKYFFSKRKILETREEYLMEKYKLAKQEYKLSNISFVDLQKHEVEYAEILEKKLRLKYDYVRKWINSVFKVANLEWIINETNKKFRFNSINSFKY